MQNKNNDAISSGADSSQQKKKGDSHQESKGPKFIIDIEGTEHPWDKDTISAEEIAQLGGWNISEGVLVIDLKDGTESNLAPGESVEVKPGMGFSKKVRFKRG